VVAANLPDIDIISGLPGSVGYIEHHRGFTHGITGIAVLSLALAAVLYPLTKSFWKPLLVALVAMGTHPALDYANTYGVQPLLPFSDTRYYGDLLNVIDPYLDGILLVGCVASYFLNKRRLVACGTVVAALIYIGGRVELRDTARASLELFKSSVPGAERIAVIPGMLDPSDFRGIVETPDEYIKVRIKAWPGTRTPPEEVARFKKGDWSSPVVSHASATKAGAVFRGFARFPGVHTDETADGYRVLFIDFRFYNDQAGRGFAAEIELDRSLHPTAESLSFNRTAVPGGPDPGE
jgi:inner membrane protein